MNEQDLHGFSDEFGPGQDIMTRFCLEFGFVAWTSRLESSEVSGSRFRLLLLLHYQAGC